MSKNVPKFIFEHKIIKEEIETLRHIYIDKIIMNPPEPGFYKSLTVTLSPDHAGNTEVMFISITFHLEEQYPEQA